MVCAYAWTAGLPHPGRGASSEQEIPLRHRQHLGGLASEQLPIGAHRIGLGVYFHMRQVVVVDEMLFTNGAYVFHRAQLLGQPKISLMPAAKPACETKVSEPFATAPPKLPNIGR